MNEKIIKELIKAIEILNENIEENKKEILEIKEILQKKSKKGSDKNEK